MSIDMPQPVFDMFFLFFSLASDIDFVLCPGTNHITDF